MSLFSNFNHFVFSSIHFDENKCIYRQQKESEMALYCMANAHIPTPSPMKNPL